MAKTTNASDKFIVRLPDGMRDRIKRSADRNGRTMNAEIVVALEQVFPPEPTVQDVLEKVHGAINLAKTRSVIPYREELVESLDKLSELIAEGLEPEQFSPSTPAFTPDDKFINRFKRWKRAQKYGVEQSDLEHELENGLFDHLRKDRLQNAIRQFKKGRPDNALIHLGLRGVKFKEPEKAYAAIEAHIREFFNANWGDPDTSDSEWKFDLDDPRSEDD